MITVLLITATTLAADIALGIAVGRRLRATAGDTQPTTTKGPTT